jgi:hypothetical protein
MPSNFVKNLTSLFPFFFGLIFFISGFYQLPFFYLDLDIVILVKRSLLVALMAVMLFLIDWRRTRLDLISIYCILWSVLHVIFLLFKLEYFNEYVLRISQITFIWLLVQFLRQNSRILRFAGFEKWFSVIGVSCIALAIVLGSWNLEVAREVAKGFGNNRVNFSIWLSQIVFLIFLLTTLTMTSISVPSAFVKAVLFCTPIIILQAFSGSRTGLGASILIALYFAKKAGGLRLSILALIYLSVLIYISNILSPLNGIGHETYVLRNTELNYDFSNDPNYMPIALLDRFSSMRLSIMASAFHNVSLSSLILGNGLNNFQGMAFGQYFHVHNIYIRALGEFGLMGFFTSLSIITLPFWISNSSANKGAAKALCAIFAFIGFLHPEILISAINTCLIYWVAYAYVLSDDKIEEVSKIVVVDSNTKTKVSQF